MTAVGENPYGVSAVGSTGASAITVGGPQPADRNLIAPGVTLEAVAGATVEGNLLGTDATGAATLPIPGNGAYAFIPSVGGTTYIRGNVIAGGILIGNGSPSAFETILQGNFIGTDATGTVDLGGGVIDVDTTDVIVGGTGPGEGNVIAYGGERLGRAGRQALQDPRQLLPLKRWAGSLRASRHSTFPPGSASIFRPPAQRSRGRRQRRE